MKCIICSQEMYDKFEDSYIISYCSSCKLEHCQISIFKNLVISKILKLKYKPLIYTYMIEYFKNYFNKNHFGLISKILPCGLIKNCQGSIGNKCKIYQYNFHNFKFYYCFYNDLIVYNINDIEILIRFLYKVSKKHKRDLFLNKVKNWFIHLFIKKEGIENVKK